MEKGLSAQSAVKHQAVPRAASARGMNVKRLFTTPGVDPADELAWELRSVSIAGDDGQIVFKQEGVEVPKSWSLLATSVVASKYFRGAPGTPARESSVRK